ncbi:MAG TPA: class I SAM-dependent methyltransferase [Burkholderiaceae bacterium]|nr:class I SAM-dependent methyltransferase [Burkholderiaceae bacterium]
MDESDIKAIEPQVADPWRQWLASPPGRYVLAWEQEQLDTAVSDIFGFHALQLGLPEIDTLRSNRMPHRVQAVLPDEPLLSAQPPLLDLPLAPVQSGELAARTCVRIEQAEELPFDSQSLDLVVLPHVLEFAQEPHEVLREVERVLRPEGRLIVCGFNPISLWGARQAIPRRLLPPLLPRPARLIPTARLRDWLKLLSFEMDRGRYGCYRPPCRTQLWLDRTRFLESAGDRWWPVCGAVYLVAAQKRVRGMRLIGPAWKTRSRKAAAAPAVVSGRTCNRESAEAGSDRRAT